MTAALTVPSEFGRYHLLSRVGEGGMGTVYLARDTQLDRRVALKVPHFKDKENPTTIDRFYREARTAARIEHPNICRVYDVGQHQGVHYLTMEFVEGTPLSKMLSPHHPWPLFNAAALVRKIALAVQVLHQNGVMHRDLKPGNIMLRPNGEPVLMDFGLARSYQHDHERLTDTGEFMGTPAYMSPEQANAESTATLGPGTDIYSLAVILFEMVTGKLPFRGTTTMILVQLVTEPPPPPSSINPELPAPFDRVCLRALAKRPEDRYESALQFADELKPFVEAGHVLESTGPRTLGPGNTRAEPSPPPSPASNGALTGLDPGQRPTLATTKGGQLLPTNLPGPAPSGVSSESPPPSEIPPPRQGPRLPLYAGLVGAAALIAVVWSWFFGPGGTSTARTQNPDTAAAKSGIEALASKRPLSGDPWGPMVDNAIGMRLVRIAPGKFKMGTAGGGDEVQHEVTLGSTFWMGAHEVTQEQYLAVMESNPSGFHPGNGGSLEHPVDSVTWEQARTFCEKLSALPAEKALGRVYRLPTEAEWEYCCRAGSGAAWSFGDDPKSLGTYAWFRDNSGGSTHRVGDRIPNAWGLHDMHGNVYEWCADFYRPDYKEAGTVDPQGPEFGEGRVLRGGCWFQGAAECRSARRFSDTGAVRDVFIGFRVVAIRRPTTP